MQASCIKLAVETNPPDAIKLPSESLPVSSSPAPVKLTKNEMAVAAKVRLKL